MNFACLFFGVLFTTAGVLFREGKLHTRLSAWRAMTQEEKDRLNVQKLCANVGTMILLCGMIFLLSGASGPFREKFFVWDMILWLIASGVDVFYIEKSGKFSR